MKRYFKIINNNKEIKYNNQIIIIKDDMAIYNPSEKLILEDGWAIYNEKEKLNIDTKSTELSKKIKEIEKYDSSDLINVFYINDKKIWFDKVTRIGLKLLLEVELENNLEETTLWYKDTAFTLKINDAKEILKQVELYASKCYDNTQKHIANVNKLETIEKIKQYDYKSGYPEILNFNI